MNVEEFIEATSKNAYLLNKALSSNLIIPEFPDFCEYDWVLVTKVYWTAHV